MPVYGYQHAVFEPQHGLLEMREVSLDFKAADLRRIALFLMHYADRMDAGDWRSDHAHLGEFDSQWDRDHPAADIIVIHHGVAFKRS